MLIEIFVFFEIIMIGLFFTAFFTKQEIIWAIVLVISGVMAFTSYNIEYYVYEWNATITAYQPIFVSYSYPYLMGLNLLFLSLALILGLFDLFDKYGSRFASDEKEYKYK